MEGQLARETIRRRLFETPERAGGPCCLDEAHSDFVEGVAGDDDLAALLEGLHLRPELLKGGRRLVRFQVIGLAPIPLVDQVLERVLVGPRHLVVVPARKTVALEASVRGRGSADRNGSWT